MSGIKIFDFIILPAMVAIDGWVAVLANECSTPRKHRLHPGE
jgi:hypothetical protein